MFPLMRLMETEPSIPTVRTTMHGAQLGDTYTMKTKREDAQLGNILKLSARKMHTTQDALEGR